MSDAALLAAAETSPNAHRSLGRFSAPRLAALVAGLLALLLLSAALALALGEEPLSLSQALFDRASAAHAILFSLRLPRVVLAALVGAALAASGACLQSLLRNDLADPFVLGVSGGAALGGTAAIALGAGSLLATAPGFLGALAASSPTTVAAFLGALVAMWVVYAAGRVGGKLSPSATLLAGVIFNSLAAAAITAIKALAPPDRLGNLLYWLSGALGYERYPTLAFLALVQLGAIAVMGAHASRLNLLSLGDEGAASLGVDVDRTRRTLLLITSLSVAAAVALSGLIGFVGLLVPHLLRLIVGPDQRLLLPASALGGACYLVLADLVARLLFRSLGADPPVGAITALLGGPAFLWLLHRQGARLGR